MRRRKTFDDYPPVLTTAQTAELLQVSAQTLRNWRWRGRGPKFLRLSSNRVRYRLSDVLDWMQSNTFSSTTEAEAASTLQRAIAG